MKKLNYIIIVIIDLLALYSCEDAIDSAYVPSTQQNSDNEVICDNQLLANEINQKFLNATVVKTRANDAYSCTIYPDYYGGSYITSNGHLVLLVYGDSLNAVKKIKSIINSDIVEYKKSKYSYQYLNEVMGKISELLPYAKKDIRDNIVGFGILDDENCIEIDVVSAQKSKIYEIINLFKFPMLKIVETGRFIDNASLLLQPGVEIDRLISGNTVSGGSCAFRAKDNSTGKLGVVSSGHAFTSADDIAYVNSKKVGKCIRAQNKGNVDASFVEIDTAKCQLSNIIVNAKNKELSIETSNPGVGTFVNFRGAIHNGSDSNTKGGVIKSIKYETTYNNTKYTNMSTAAYNSTDGDSGGIIYTYVSAKNKCYTVGVHKGSTKSGLSVFSKADLVLTALKISRY